MERIKREFGKAVGREEKSVRSAKIAARRDVEAGRNAKKAAAREAKSVGSVREEVGIDGKGVFRNSKGVGSAEKEIRRKEGAEKRAVQVEGRRRWSGEWGRQCAALVLAAACALLPAQSAWAGWQQEDGKHWVYRDDETGEIAVSGLDQESVCHLMENALIEANLYQDELAPTVVRLIYEDEKSYTVGAGYVVDMDHTEYYNIFQVDKRTWEAYSRSTKHRFQLKQ